MIDDVEARFATRIIRTADIEQHRETFALEALERRANLSRRNANDAGIGDVRPNGSRVESSAPGWRSLRTWHC